MTTYISILRGINSGGYRIVQMDALRSLYAKLGYSNVQSYIQSGNVIFQREKASHPIIENEISGSISKEFGFDVSVIIIECEELKQLISDNPLLKDETKDSSKIHVTFLSGIPEKGKFDAIKGGNYQNDEFHLVNKAVYLYCPNGYGKTKLTTGFLENKLKVMATCRNWKTTVELLKMGKESVANNSIG